MWWRCASGSPRTSVSWETAPHRWKGPDSCPRAPLWFRFRLVGGTSRKSEGGRREKSGISPLPCIGDFHFLKGGKLRHQKINITHLVSDGARLNPGTLLSTPHTTTHLMMVSLCQSCPSSVSLQRTLSPVSSDPRMGDGDDEGPHLLSPCSAPGAMAKLFAHVEH